MVTAKINQINYKKNIAIHIFATLTVLAVIIYFGIMQSINEISHLKLSINIEMVNQEKDYIRGKNLRKVAENLKTVEPEIPKLESVFIKKDDALSFFISLEKIAEKNNIDQKINLSGTTNFDSDSNKKTTEIIPIQLSSSGSFSREMLYLKDLESLAYYLNVKTLEISNTSFNKKNYSEIEEIENSFNENYISLQIMADTYWKN